MSSNLITSDRDLMIENYKLNKKEEFDKLTKKSLTSFASQSNLGSNLQALHNAKRLYQSSIKRDGSNASLNQSNSVVSINSFNSITEGDKNYKKETSTKSDL